ncbi:MAG TPA: 4-alpha-glucanotransferase [Micropepsaceae bacterium]|nr:4-alpha-glucanotransferase [Micropepsaceae bacterium]
MSEDALTILARAAGLAPDWTDAFGNQKNVPPETLRVVLNALGLPANSQSDIADSRHRLSEHKPAPMLVARIGDRLAIGTTRRAVIHFEDGTADVSDLDFTDGGAFITAPPLPGYHRIETDECVRTLAIAPRCLTIADVAHGRRLSGLAVQLYALQGGHSAGFGDLAALADFAERSASFGVDAVAISPLHAPLLAASDDFSPYSPSTRLFLNPLYADPMLAGGESAKDHNSEPLVDWPRASREKIAALRATFARFKENDPPDDYTSFCVEQGGRLVRHARFEALDGHFRSQGIGRWQVWPKPFQDFASLEVENFARENADAVDFHIFLQWLTAKSLTAAHHRACAAGMAVGLISDIAVGMNPAGSHAWSAPDEILTGLSVGAPPDVINQQGQNWGLTALSPTGLKQSAYDGFIATLRASMRHAGGVRIDHAMGLRRLWLVPDGATVAEGAYLRYPMNDLLNLVALESRRYRAIVIGEDLGTVPEGFRDAMLRTGLMGMEVLWFQRDGSRFLGLDCWHKHRTALSTTHDLPTIAGWWTGRDIDWQEKLGWINGPGGVAAERNTRVDERHYLWSTLEHAGSAKGTQPPPEDPAPAIEAALDFVGRSPCELAIVPVEDILALREQPNIPGTIHEHPNWRRRLPPGDPFASPEAQTNLAALRRARTAS